VISGGSHNGIESPVDINSRFVSNQRSRSDAYNNEYKEQEEIWYTDMRTSSFSEFTFRGSETPQSPTVGCFFPFLDNQPPFSQSSPNSDFIPGGSVYSSNGSNASSTIEDDKEFEASVGLDKKKKKRKKKSKKKKRGFMDETTHTLKSWMNIGPPGEVELMEMSFQRYSDLLEGEELFEEGPRRYMFSYDLDSGFPPPDPSQISSNPSVDPDLQDERSMYFNYSRQTGLNSRRFYSFDLEDELILEEIEEEPFMMDLETTLLETTRLSEISTDGDGMEGGVENERRVGLGRKLLDFWEENFSFNWLESIINQIILPFFEILALMVRRQFQSDIDYRLMESFRLQPFAAGAFIRGLIFTGFVNYLFLLYSWWAFPPFFSLPPSNPYFTPNPYSHLHEDVSPPTLESSHYVWSSYEPEDDANHLKFFYSLDVVQCASWSMQLITYLWLLLFLAIHFLQLPMRIYLYSHALDVSRAPEVDTATDVLHDLLDSNFWIFNQFLGTIWLILAGFGHILYLFTPLSTPDSTLILSISSSNIVALIIRTILTVMFYHSSQIAHRWDDSSSSRGRGLSTVDMDRLGRFLFSNSPEDQHNLTSTSCAICLSPFEMGELLVNLPCDNRHCFHDSCIRQWLERQNSCPLCQKSVIGSTSIDG